ncbi:hypothetical protein XNC1_0658 [Xenorhabdus nematophila ATCC 19061]|uniref:Uncharacterized protein n=1 Tax=Xenorhabdus nematophila (strain ATCC 19061 / DSM 3370 / CCUG 14189 / LMG 1036 / NCIMB 9965 / AN6) TaxID=406817 RepID=D3VJH3_XENNA|nr:hypothetical protein XNC1_0658 [Xenorhabdus nematophila ATCC 19061]CEK21643.1 hypothetical protein XNC2_0647 [Xenorhabdus nematophila AN6/1]
MNNVPHHGYGHGNVHEYELSCGNDRGLCYEGHVNAHLYSQQYCEYGDALFSEKIKGGALIAYVFWL